MDGRFNGSPRGGKHRKITMEQIIEMTINRFSKESGALSWKLKALVPANAFQSVYMAALKQHLEKCKSYKHVELSPIA